jgi:hypothetical protein
MTRNARALSSQTGHPLRIAWLACAKPTPVSDRIWSEFIEPTTGGMK